MRKPVVFVGMSGGVDSAVAAALLVRSEKYEVVGCFLKNWSETKNFKGECNWVQERIDALRTAAKLQIPFRTFDFEKEYRKTVVDYLFKEYQAGRTPNPDVRCNTTVKFGVFFKEAQKLGADFVATGHYVKLGKKAGQYFLAKAKDKNKDQSYFLQTLGQKELAHSLFPLGNLTKPEVRRLAKKFGFTVADKPDSQGICFIGEVPMKEFLKSKLPIKKGKIVSVDGKVLGQHDGAWFYTIGQKAGIGGGPEPWYVTEKRIKKNELVVAQGNEAPELFKKELRVGKIHWIAGKTPKLPLACTAKIRYRQPDQKCTVFRSGKVVFTKPQRAVTPGQFCVFYKGQEMLGGGVIVSP